MQKVIGGEFDIDISKMGQMPEKNNTSLFSSGRAALFYILKSIANAKHKEFSKILLPDYLCQSVIDAVQKSNFKFDFYKINSNLSVDLPDLKNKLSENSIILLINYFGCIDIENQIENVRSINKDCCIIADNVQAFYSMKQAKQAEYSFTSFRKIFPVPDGAFVETLYGKLEVPNQENTFVASKIAGGILKHFADQHNIDDSIYLHYLNLGEKEIDQNYNAVASDFSQILIESLDFDIIAERRKRNSAFIMAGLKKLEINPIVTNNQNQIPLFIPIRLKNRNEVRNEMFSQNIFCPIHWPSPKGFKLFRGEELSLNELSLIIDQRYDENDMQRILDILKKFQ